MYTSRISQIEKICDDDDLDLVLITDSIEVEYLTNFKSSNVTLLVNEKQGYLFTDFRYKQLAEEFTNQNSFWTFILITELIAKHIQELVSENSVKIGFQSDLMSFDRYKKLSKIPNIEWIALGEKVSLISNIKTDKEIQSISEAAQIADKSLSELLKTIKIGESEFEVAQRLNKIALKNGSEKPSFDTIILFGVRSALPHGTPSKEIFLKNGDTILCDFGCTVNGFCSDMTRTFFYKSVDKKMKEIYNVVLEAQKRGREFLKPGVLASDVDKICRDFIDNSGYKEYFGHATGHSVGLRIHEKPAISKKDTTLLLEGMVVTIEPGIYIPNIGGVRIEDLMVVTKNSSKSLSSSKRELLTVNYMEQ